MKKYLITSISTCKHCQEQKVVIALKARQVYRLDIYYKQDGNKTSSQPLLQAEGSHKVRIINYTVVVCLMLKVTTVTALLAL